MKNALQSTGAFLTLYPGKKTCSFNTIIRTATLVLTFISFCVFAGNATDGTGVVTVTANGNSCVGFTAAQSDGPDNWEVAEGGSYTMTISGVTECDGNTITVFVQNSSTGNFCFNATGGNGTYTGTFSIPNPACNTMPVSYKCGANQACDNADTYNADGPSGNGKVHLRGSHFDGNCNKTEGDEDCNLTCVCEAPSNITVDSISAAEAEVCWEGDACDQGYIVGWRTVPQTEWLYTTVSSPQHCLIFTNHYDDVFEIQIAAICHDGDTSDYSAIFTFATYPSCLAPTNPFTSNIKATQAKLNWTGVSDASKYVISYRQSGNATWTKRM